jgi:hypothetical protein
MDGRHSPFPQERPTGHRTSVAIKVKGLVFVFSKAQKLEEDGKVEHEGAKAADEPGQVVNQKVAFYALQGDVKGCA